MDSFIQGQVIDNRFLHEIANEASRRKGFKGRTIGKVVKGGDQIKKTNSCMGKKSTLPTISYHKRGKKSRHYPPFPLQKYPAQPMAKKKNLGASSGVTDHPRELNLSKVKATDTFPSCALVHDVACRYDMNCVRSKDAHKQLA